MVCELFGHTAAAVAALRDALTGLEVDEDTMAANLRRQAGGPRNRPPPRWRPCSVGHARTSG